MNKDELYMQRCITLAQLGAGCVAPNPLVGAVLVHNNTIIGEGYHQEYGKAHAEVNCINSVRDEDKIKISEATLYISMEPCSHVGKTPPCVDFILKNKINIVVIGSYDPTEKVNGKGVARLKEAGVQIVMGVLKKECEALNCRFFFFHTARQPYVVLKWAQSANRQIGKRNERIIISNEITNRLVHKWRSEASAILIGTNTACIDNPLLDNRFWTGRSPQKLLLDTTLRVPNTLQIFHRENGRILIFNLLKNEQNENVFYCKIDNTKNICEEILQSCYKLQLQSIMIEGGATLLQSFINSGRWNEAEIITNTILHIEDGIAAPTLSNEQIGFTKMIQKDRIDFYINSCFL